MNDIPYLWIWTIIISYHGERHVVRQRYARDVRDELKLLVMAIFDHFVQTLNFTLFLLLLQNRNPVLSHHVIVYQREKARKPYEPCDYP
jgi:hypothetical protein